MRGREDRPGTATEPRDPTQLLLHRGASRAERDRARRVATCLRLLVHAAAGTRAEDEPRPLARAREELERVVADEAVDALLGLTYHHLAAHLGGDAFRLWPAPARDLAACWRIALGKELLAVPEPGAQPRAVARSAWQAAREAAGPFPELRGRVRIAEAWLRRAEDGPLAGAEAFGTLLAPDPSASESRAEPEGAPRCADGHAEGLEALAGQAACLLDAGAVRRARALLEGNLGAVACDARLAHLAVWSCLLDGDEEAARSLARGLEPFAGVLPAALAQLRELRPAWGRWLTGAAPEPAHGAGAPWPVPLSGRDLRRSLGASLVTVSALGPGGSVRHLVIEAAPGLAGKVEERLLERDGVTTLPREPEHRLVARARTVRAHGEGQRGGEPRGAVAEGTVALALAPVLVDRGPHEGEVAGWIRIECEHFLLPSDERLSLLARAWTGPVLAAFDTRVAWMGEGPSTAGTWGVAEAGVAEGGVEAGGPDRARSAQPDDPRAEAFTSFAEGLGMKTALRRWWGFDLEDGEGRPVAEGGGALADRDRRPGRARALARAVATRAPIRFDEPDPGLAVHADAACGVALPLVLRGRPVGAFVVESTRRRDFRERDEVRLADAAAAFVGAWRAAQFRAWHLEAHGYDVVVDDAAPGFLQASTDLAGAAGAEAAVAIVGPAGAGKEILARRLHFESGGGRDALPLRILCGAATGGERAIPSSGGAASPAWVGQEARERARTLLGSGRDGAVLVDELDRGAPWLQELVLEHLRRGVGSSGEGPRLLVTLGAPPGERSGTTEPGLLPELARRLGRLVVRVEPLARRRAEIPALIHCFGRRFAREEGLAPPILDDRAVALLWRQAWPGNVGELENLMYQLVLLGPRAEADPRSPRRLGADEVRAVAERCGARLLARLPSRHPDPADVEAALRCTRHRGGGWNKTRAALYLGWDPDTLVARLRDLARKLPRPERPHGAP